MSPDKPEVPKHTGGKFRKGVSGNPGGKKKVFAPYPPAPQADQTASDLAPQPEVEKSEKTAQKQRRGGFQPGVSGNPAGRPKGARNHATLLAEALIDGQSRELTQRAVQMALAGDASIMRALLDRLIAPRRDRPVSLEIPKIERAADLVGATAALTAAAADGTITPSEASDLVRLVEGTARSIETADLAERLARLEEQIAVRGNA